VGANIRKLWYLASAILLKAEKSTVGKTTSMKLSNKPRVFLALYDRGKLSLPPHQDELGLASFHWALLITPKDSAEGTHMLDVTDAMQIDPVRHLDTNPDRNWIMRDKVENPLSNIRLVLIAMVGKLKSRADAIDELVDLLKKECRVPNKNMAGENCAWWVKGAVRFLHSKGLLNEFDIDLAFREAQQQATDRIGGTDIAKKRSEVLNLTTQKCHVSFEV
jgi:hypothetical protein